MVEHVCLKCEKIFKQKSQLDAHNKRKTPCKKDGTIEKIVEQKVQEVLSTRLPLLASPDNQVRRLNYIGSKYQLLDWIGQTIKSSTGWSSFTGRRIADLFAGTGAVSYYFRRQNAIVTANDAELYSSVITHAFTCSVWTPQCAEFISTISSEIDLGRHSDTSGFIAQNYSPLGKDGRMYFTIENARRIDYIRQRIEDTKPTMNKHEYAFLLASLITSADTVSNVPAVYGCYLHAFKAKAQKALRLEPVHTLSILPADDSNVHTSDVLSRDLLSSINADAVYLDPPYNQRQYSKNYFPLNMIALTPAEQAAEKPLTGKTGIPTTCFRSPFCRKGGEVEKAFDILFSGLNSPWIFLSYSSESLVSRDEMVKIMEKYGNVTVVEQDYKKFKCYEYNENSTVKEYIFCLRKTLSQSSEETIQE